MKFRRFLAALLGSLMIVSMMSFTANVSADGDGIIKLYVGENYAERGGGKQYKYDEATGIGYGRIWPNDTEANAAKSCYLNLSGQAIKPTAAQIADDTVYVVFYVRTNMTLDSNDLPSLMNYQTYWGTAEKNIKQDGSNTLVTDNSNFATQVGNDWRKICFKLATTKSVDLDGNAETPNTVEPIYKWDQLAFLAVGTASTNPIKDWAAKAPEGSLPYVDLAGYVVTTNLKAAEEFDFVEAAAAPTYTVTFDKGYTADDDSDVETVEAVITKYSGKTVEFPELTAPADGYEFLGWYTDAAFSTLVADTAAVEITGDATYYALWQNNSVPVEFTLDSLTINGSDASKFGVEDINADEIVVTLPYGWEALEDFGVMPTVVPTATVPATAEYVAPATLADAGKIVFTQGNSTGEVAIKFVIGAAPEAKTAGTNKVQAGVYSTTGVITLPDGSEINTDNKIRAVGLKTDKEITHYGITANKFTPIYKGGELDGTMVSSTEYYTSNRSTNLEGYNAFGTFDFESYNAYRALVYYDTGADGEFDIEVNPRLYFQSGGTTGTMNTDAVGRADSFVPASALKGDRWEYIYFTKSEKNKVLYGKAVQPVFAFFAKDTATKASNYKDDTFYFAQVEMLAECPEVVSYKPTSINAVAVDGDTPGCINGVTDDMELLVDGEWVAVTELDNYANGTIDGLTAGEYSVRYAADDVYGASEATVLEVLPGAVFVTFDAQNDTENTVYELEINTALTAPANPTKGGYIFKGWATEKDGEVVTVPAVATETITYYAVWEKIEVVYVKGSAETNGDGLTPETPYNTWASAGIFAYNYGGTIVVMDDVAWTQKVNNGSSNSNYNYVYADVTITSVDPVTGVDYPGALVQTGSQNFWGDWTKTITIKDIEIASWRYQSASDKWQYINFNGMIVDLDDITVRTGDVPVGYTVGSSSPVADGDAKEIYFPVHMRTLGEAGGKGNGVTNAVIGDVEFKSIVVGGKVIYNEANNWYAADIDFEFHGSSNSALIFGNDSTRTTSEGKNYYHYGRLNNVKMLLGTAPKSIGFSCITGINGSVQMIANNGAVVAAPVFSYTNKDDKTTNEDGSIFTADLTPAKGFWKINSAEGGRVDFTETDGTFAVTTDATYIVVTDIATGEATKIRVADGATGDANLFEDGVYTLTLDEGEYNIAYTEEGVKVNVTFENGDADETYTLSKGETATYTGTVTVPAGYVFEGWANADGSVAIEGNSYTADSYVASEIILVPVLTKTISTPAYITKGVYNQYAGIYTVTVYLSNEKYTLGTLGIQFDKDALVLNEHRFGESVENYMGTVPEIVGDYMTGGDGDVFMLLWNAKQDAIDATTENVELITFTFEVKDKTAFEAKFGTDFPAFTPFYPQKDYKKHYENGSYKAVLAYKPGDDEYAINYVDIVFAQHTDELAESEYADVTFNVNPKSKNGATVTNTAYLAYTASGEDAWTFVALEEAGNENAIAKTVSDTFRIGGKYDIKILKNGYIAYCADAFEITGDCAVNAELLGGDIKGSATGENADAVDFGDFGDGKVDISDFIRVIRAFDDASSDDFRATVDINEDGVITVSDLAIIKTNFTK